MPALYSLDLSYNEFSGSIPPSIAVYAAYLNDNSFTGAVPASFLSSTKFSYLHLQNNQLSGSIPTISASGTLKDLNLANNMLTGSIPSTVGDFSALVNLSLAYNQLTGEIPASFGNFKTLKKLNLENNAGLAGVIPAGMERPESVLTEINITGTAIGGCWPFNRTFNSWSFCSFLLLFFLLSSSYDSDRFCLISLLLQLNYQPQVHMLCPAADRVLAERDVF